MSYAISMLIRYKVPCFSLSSMSEKFEGTWLPGGFRRTLGDLKGIDERNAIGDEP